MISKRIIIIIIIIIIFIVIIIIIIIIIHGFLIYEHCVIKDISLTQILL